MSPDYASITEPNEPDISEFTPHIKAFLDHWKIKAFINQTDDIFHLSTKQGPNGQALGSSLKEASLLPEELVRQITTFSESIGTSLSIVREYNKQFTQIDWKEPKLRKVVPIQDKEGKTRIIALLDYWSQAALKMLHDTLMYQLEKIPHDRTKNQTGHGHDWSCGEKIFSYDLSSATDRFPINLQVELLAHLIGREKAIAWKEIMTNYEYMKPDGTSVKYNAGQPMGAYSSWVVFTLCHHLVVYVAHLNAKRDMKYILLGDDIAIAGEDLALEYSRLLKVLNIKIAYQKSFKSTDFYEFAKRSYFKGVEVTPLPLNAVVEARSLNELAYTLTQLIPFDRLYWSRPLMITLLTLALGNRATPIKVRSTLSKLMSVCLFPLNQRDGTLRHTLMQYVRMVIPVPCGNIEFAERKFILALKFSVRKELIEQCNSLDAWFQKIYVESASLRENWVKANLPGEPVNHVPLEAIYEREVRRFTDMISSASEDAFGGIDDKIGKVIKVMISDPRLLSTERKHLVINQALTLLSQRILKKLQLIRDKDIHYRTTPLQVGSIRFRGNTKMRDFNEDMIHELQEQYRLSLE